MKFTYSRHALDEMKRRGISARTVQAVLDSPGQIIPDVGQKQVYQSKIRFGKAKTFLVRVVVAFDVDPPLVVTVYRTSKIDKYWSVG
jgi:hypothetical protein